MSFVLLGFVSHFPLLPAKNLTHVSGLTFRAFCSSATGRNGSGLGWGCRGERRLKKKNASFG